MALYELQLNKQFHGPLNVDIADGCLSSSLPSPTVTSLWDLGAKKDPSSSGVSPYTQVDVIHDVNKSRDTLLLVSSKQASKRTPLERHEETEKWNEMKNE